MTNPARKSSGKVYGLWALFAIPGVALLAQDALSSGKVEYLRWTGLLSVWFLLVTMAVTPLRRIAPSHPVVKWLRTNRRYLGVASFWYAMLHLAYFMKNTNVEAFLKTFVRIEIVTGWIALAIMIALTATSFDAAVRRMGPAWRRLHWWVYPAAILTAFHWATTSYRFGEMTLYIGPLIVLMILARTRTTTRRAGASDTDRD